jgi:hypothetical protein
MFKHKLSHTIRNTCHKKTHRTAVAVWKFSSYNSASSKYGSLAAETIQLFPRKTRGYTSPNNTVGYTGYKWKTLDNWNPRGSYGISRINKLTVTRFCWFQPTSLILSDTKGLWRNCIQVRVCVFVRPSFLIVSEKSGGFSWNLMRTSWQKSYPERCNILFIFSLITPRWRLCEHLRWKRR